MFSVDVIYCLERSLVKKLGRFFNKRDYDVILLSHPSAVGTLYTAVNLVDSSTHVVTSREAARRFDVVRAMTEQFGEDVAVKVLSHLIVDKAAYLELWRA